MVGLHSIFDRPSIVALDEDAEPTPRRVMSLYVKSEIAGHDGLSLASRTGRSAPRVLRAPAKPVERYATRRRAFQELRRQGRPADSSGRPPAENSSASRAGTPASDELVGGSARACARPPRRAC